MPISLLPSSPGTTSKMKTLLEITALSADFLAKKGVASPKKEAEWLVSGALGLKRLDIYVWHDRPVTGDEMDRIRPLLERRGRREPLQYILGEVDFLDCVLKVNSDVLIPRPETEILADKIIRSIDAPEGKVFWDICTGSGCLAIAIKKKIPSLTVVASDASAAALEVARHNAAKNGVEIEFLLGDLLAPFEGRAAHYVVSNPPYVSQEDYDDLEPEVRHFEPKGALVSGKTGKEIYARLSRELPGHLEAGATVWLEIGPADTAELFKNPAWGESKMELDWAGRPRFITIQTPI